MRDMLVVCSEVDAASVNIRDRMLELGTFQEEGTFEGRPVYSGHEGHLVTIGDESLYRNNLDAEVFNAIGVQHQVVVYLSRHSSKTGLRSLTVHPIGNFSHAKFGGFFRQLVHCCPGGMTRSLRSIRTLAKEAGLDHQVSFEVTHHGPYLNSPTFFIEIGSDEEAWTERAPAEVIAKTVLEAVPGARGHVLVGVGGGHYAPRHTDVALKKDVCYSHMIPSHAIAALGTQMLDKMLDYVCESRMVYFHRKAMPKAEVRRFTEFFESRDMRIVRERDLPDLPDLPGLPSQE
jgi:D-aminoacyl-tRNA deacylase